MDTTSEMMINLLSKMIFDYKVIKSKIRKLIIIFLVSIIVSSCHNEWVIRPEIKGRVISKQNKQIVARIITLPVE